MPKEGYLLFTENVKPYLVFTVSVEYESKNFDVEVEDETVSISVGSAEEIAEYINLFRKQDYEELFFNESFFVEQIRSVDFDGLRINAVSDNKDATFNLSIFNSAMATANLNLSSINTNAATKLQEIRQILDK